MYNALWILIVAFHIVELASKLMNSCLCLCSKMGSSSFFCTRLYDEMCVEQESWILSVNRSGSVKMFTSFLISFSVGPFKFFFWWKWHSFRWCHSDQESQEHIRMIHRSRHSIYSNLMIVVNKNRVTNAACVFFTPVSVFACESFSSHFFPRHVARGVLRLFLFLLAASFTFDPSSKWSNQIGHYNWPNTKIG